MSAVLAPRLLPRAASTSKHVWQVAASPPGGRGDANAPHADSWFASLSEPLRNAITSRARLRTVSAGTSLAQRGDTNAGWVGVVRGAMRLGTSLADGRNFTLDFVGPNQWFGDIALVDGGPQDLDMVAHVPSTLLVVSPFDVRRLMENMGEFREALLQLNCRRLRHMYRRFEELHTLALPQRLARQVQRLAARFGRPLDQGVSIDLAVSQGDLAAMVGGSRQRVNRSLRQMHLLGIVQLGTSRLVVLDEARLDAVADGRIALPNTDAAGA